MSGCFVQKDFFAFRGGVCCVEQVASFICGQEQDVEDEHEGEDANERGRRSSCL